MVAREKSIKLGKFGKNFGQNNGKNNERSKYPVPPLPKEKAKPIVIYPLLSFEWDKRPFPSLSEVSTDAQHLTPHNS